jgi:hypothetical protein
MASCAPATDWYQHYLALVPKFDSAHTPAAHIQITIHTPSGNYGYTAPLFNQTIQYYNDRVKVFKAVADEFLLNIYNDATKCIDIGTHDLAFSETYFSEAATRFENYITATPPAVAPIINLLQAHLHEASAMVAWYLQYLQGVIDPDEPTLMNSFNANLKAANDGISSYLTSVISTYSTKLSNYLYSARLTVYNAHLSLTKTSSDNYVSIATSAFSAASTKFGTEADSALSALTGKVNSAISLIPNIKACSDFQTCFNQYALVMGKDGTAVKEFNTSSENIINAFNTSVKALKIYSSTSDPKGKAFTDLISAAISAVSKVSKSAQDTVYAKRLDSHKKVIDLITAFYTPAFNVPLSVLSTALTTMLSTLTSKSASALALPVGTGADNAYQSVVDYYMSQMGGPDNTSAILDPYNASINAVPSALNTAIQDLSTLSRQSSTGEYISMVVSKGQYFSLDSSNKLICTSKDYSATSGFYITVYPDNRISLKASNGKYLSVDLATGVLTASASTVTDKEKFTPTWSGSTLVLKAANGGYFSASGGGGSSVIANVTTSGVNEKFTFSRVTFKDFTDPIDVLTKAIQTLSKSVSDSASAKIKDASDKANTIIKQMYDAVYNKRRDYHVATIKAATDTAVASLNSAFSTFKSGIDSVLSTLDSKIQAAVALIPGTQADSAYQSAVNWYSTQLGGPHQSSPLIDAFNKSVADSLAAYNKVVSPLPVYSKPDPAGEFINLVTALGYSVSISDNNMLVCPLFDVGLTSTFTIVNNSGGSVSFKGSNGKYLTCDTPGNLSVTADSIGPNEQFTPTWTDVKLSLKGPNGKYVSAFNGGASTLSCIATSVGPNETFTTSRVSTKDFSVPEDNSVSLVNTTSSAVSKSFSDYLSSSSDKATAIIKKMYDATYAKFKSEATQGIADLTSGIQNAVDIYNGYIGVLHSAASPLNVALTKMNNYIHNNPIKYPLFTTALFTKLRTAKGDLSKIRSDAIDSANQVVSLSGKDVDTRYRALYQTSVDNFDKLISRHTVYGSQDEDFYKYYVSVQDQASKIVQDKSKDLSTEVSIDQPVFDAALSKFSTDSQSLIDKFINGRPILRLTGKMTIPPLNYKGDNDFKFEIENKGGGTWSGAFAIKFLNWEIVSTDTGLPDYVPTYGYKAYIWDKGLNHYVIRPGEKVMITDIIPFDRLFQGVALGNLKFNIVPLTESGI